MRTLTMRRPASAVTSAAPGWSGPRVIAVCGASGGAGASTLCALLAGAIAELAGTTERRSAIVDAGDGPGSPWPDWLSPGLDPALGEDGLQLLGHYAAARDGYPRALMLRAAGAIRGLDGVAVLTRTEPGQSRTKVGDLTGGFTATVQDLPREPTPELATRFLDAPGGLLLVIAGTADGVAAGIRATRAWASAGLPPSRIRPVVVVGGSGGLSPRARSRLALLDTNTQAVSIVPFDPAIARRGLAEALACGAVAAPTRIAVRRVVAGLRVPGSAALADTESGDLALFEVPTVTPAAPLLPSVRSAYEGTSR